MDPRISQAITIIEAIIGKVMINYSNILITENNMLVIISDQTLLYEVPLKGFTEQYPAIAFNLPSTTTAKFDYNEIQYISNNIVLRDYMLKMYSIYKNIELCCPKVACDFDLQDNEEFKKLLSLKSDQGLKFYNMIGINPVDSFLIPMFAGLVSLNKFDELNLSVYDLLDGNLSIVFEIDKKKIGRSFKVYCKTIKL